MKPLKIKIMRFYHILYRKFLCTGILLLCILLTGTINAQPQKAKKVRQLAEISIKVVDENGTAVPGAQVTVGEGVIHTETDQNGSVSVKAYPDDFVTVYVPGYERSVSLVSEILLNNNIKLAKSKLFMTSDDVNPLPFLNQKKRNITGSTVLIPGDKLETYPSTDIRNALTGLATGLEITERYSSPGFSTEEKNASYRITEKVGVNSRGRPMAYIIDDVFIDATELPLDPAEIESVTVIKDVVGKAMFGPAGADGIIQIKTKRGRPNERILTVNAEGGVSMVDRFPGWASGAEYARLNNQARKADGLTENFDDQEITAIAKNDPYDKYHPSIDFRDMLLKNTMTYRRANVSSSGGTDMLKYSAYLGYSGEDDIFKMGSSADYNRITARSNIDITINDAVSVQFDINGGLTLRQSPNYGYATSESSSATDLMEMSSVMSDITTIPPTEFPVYASFDPKTNIPWYAITTRYQYNPIGNIEGNGYYTETGRTGTANFAFNYDMSKFIKGFKSRTFIGINGLDLLRRGKAENYFAYIATPSVSQKTGNDTILLTLSRTGVFTANLSNLHDYYYQRFSFFENLSYDRQFGNHAIQSTLTYFRYKVAKNGISETQRMQNLIWTGMYSFNGKYTIQGVLNYAGTYTLDEDERYKLFPSVGASWVISDENFMANAKFINYLKLRAEAGILGYENFRSSFYYRDSYSYNTSGTTFGPNTTLQWFGTTQSGSIDRAYPSRIGNPGLTWEKRKEFSAGLDAVLFNNRLYLEMTYYNNLREGEVIRRTNSVPYMAGFASALPYFNYNNTRYSGLETGVQITDNIGKFTYSIGGNATIQNSKYEKYDEPAYRNDYQIRTGKSANTYWGLTCLGKFASDAEATEVPQLYDAVLHKDDLKYKDMNGDGVVDDNDMSAIGHTDPRLYFAINARLSYENFEIAVIGTGDAFYDLPLTNRYFWNGWGDGNYSDFVRDNIGGAYPKLTYYKVNNNFVSSDFWLTKGGYFKIQNVELAYNLPPNILQAIHTRGARIFVRGANVLTLTKVKEVDPESISSGIDTYPLFKTFSGGIKLTF
jgi:TonB-linked SusC/RagA family outer membrane protein